MPDSPIFTAVPRHSILSDIPATPTPEALAEFKSWELACAKRAARAKVYRYIFHGIWIPIVVCIGIVYLNLLIHTFFNIEIIKGIF